MARKKASLPRVTLLAYSRRDLLRFSEAAEKISTAANDLERGVESLNQAVAALVACATALAAAREELHRDEGKAQRQARRRGGSPGGAGSRYGSGSDHEPDRLES